MQVVKDPTLKNHNRPALGLWYLRRCNDGKGAIQFQLSSPKRSWKNDPIFTSGDVLVVVEISTYVDHVKGRYGWIVRALDRELKQFEFFHGDETPFRSAWER